MGRHCSDSETPGRFDHSLGVSHLARKMGDHIMHQQKQELEVEKDDITCLEVAGVQAPWHHTGLCRSHTVCCVSADEQASQSCLLVMTCHTMQDVAMLPTWPMLYCCASGCTQAVQNAREHWTAHHCTQFS